MLHSNDPRRAAIMLALCHEGNHIYEIMYTTPEGHFGWSFVQAANFDEAEEILFKDLPGARLFGFREVKP